MVRKRVGVTLVLAALAGAAVVVDRASAGFVTPPKSLPDLPLTTRLAVDGAAHEPWGFTMLCRRSPDVCADRPGRLPVDDVGAVRLDHATLALVERAHRLVNQAIRPQAEKAGAPDNWKVGGQAGDCEDYALAKREMLIRLGVPSSALRIATGHLRNGEYHAVLVVRTDRGDLVLDNLARAVRTWDRSGLRFDTIQNGRDARTWERVNLADTAVPRSS